MTFVIAASACRPQVSKQSTTGTLTTGTLTSIDGELVLSTSGRELRSENLVGATLQIGDATVRLEAVIRDSIRPKVLLHHFVRLQAQGSPVEICDRDALGETWAFPIASQTGEVELVCSSGAIGKCIRWGYPPAMDNLHRSCVRMVRADYGGDGTSWTRDGTLIAFCDRAGVNPCPHAGHDIEAAWSPEGAVCVSRPRIEETAGDVRSRYPHIPSHCTMATADRRAQLFNWVP